jgi:SpoVK/Ycf46/Vps4 family AAA+-type ATPase
MAESRTLPFWPRCGQTTSPASISSASRSPASLEAVGVAPTQTIEGSASELSAIPRFPSGQTRPASITASSPLRGLSRDLSRGHRGPQPAAAVGDPQGNGGCGAGLGATNDEREQTRNQLLVEMDGVDEWHEVIVSAATNRPDVLDPGLLWPGRCDRRMMVRLPDRLGYEGILRIHTRPLRLVRTTVGFSRADLANLCNEAALIAAGHAHHQVAMADCEEPLGQSALRGGAPRL